MELQGTQWIGNTASGERTETFTAYNPKDASALAGTFHEASANEIHAAIELSETAFDPYRGKPSAQRAAFLDQIGEEIMALGDVLLERCHLETALPPGRLQGERARTVHQLRLFAEVVREGSWVDARIKRGRTAFSPKPDKTDIRQMLIPLGPVAIFGASNFPLAFSVAGGDTASALAAGCPVVVKGHPAHPGTSELLARAILKAANKTEMPEGVFSLVQGTGHSIGQRLVQHPLIQAVGFTGSFAGGKALFDLANQREVPIPVFAEMGSTNPVFILPMAQARHKVIAQGLVRSINLGVGQFCTNPGLVFLPDSGHREEFQEQLRMQVRESKSGTMLTAGIKEAFEKGTTRLRQLADELESGESASSGPSSGQEVRTQVFYTDYENFSQHPELAKEVFGPASILVKLEGRDQLLAAARELEGHLTASLHADESELADYQDLITILQRKVGRLVINGFPTGVEVCESMVHGGPFPATTASQTTSVGTLAIKRFARPFCYQDFPHDMLPPALQDPNPLRIWRLVDGAMQL